MQRNIWFRILLAVALLAGLLPGTVIPAPALAQSNEPAPTPISEQEPADYAAASNFMANANPTNVVLSEDFERTDLEPNKVTCDINNLVAKGWTEDAAGYCWTYSSFPAWNSTGGSNMYIYNGSGPAETRSFIKSPPLDLSQATAVTLRYNTVFGVFNDACPTPEEANCSRGKVLVKTATTDWAPVKTYVQTSQAGGLQVIDISTLTAGKSQVQVGFEWTARTANGWWALDNIQVEATAPPAAPTNVGVTANGTDKIIVNWDQTANASGYEVQLSPTGTDQWSVLTTIGRFDQTSYTHNVQCGETHHYRVLAINTSGKSQPSTVVTATSGACATGPILNETFDSGTLPTGWTKTTDAGGFGDWYFNNPNNRADSTGATSGFAITDRANANLGWWHSELHTPLLDLSSYAGVELFFTTKFVRIPMAWPMQAFVEISNDGGNTWAAAWNTERGIFEKSGQISLNITEQVAKSKTAKIRFRVTYAAEDSYWIVDNVRLVGSNNVPAKPTLAARKDGLDVLLNWQIDSNTSLSRLERSSNNGQSWEQIAEFSANVKSYSDKTTLPSTTYRYRLVGENGAGKTTSDEQSVVLGLEPALIDLKVGFDENPTGDRRLHFENLFRHFADAVYEASNGGVKIRKLTIHPNEVNGNLMDIIWQGCSSPITFDNRVASSGGIIYMPRQAGSWNTETRQYDCGAVKDFSSPGTQQQQAYILAHEFGHWYFRLDDAYAGLGQTPFSLMTNLFNSGVFQSTPPNFQWLNFATAKNYETASFSLNVWGKSYTFTSFKPSTYGNFSEWGVMSKPKSVTGVPTSQWKSDFYDPRLTAYAPADNVLAPIELPAAQQTARSVLEVCWSDGCKALNQVSASDISAAAMTVGESVANTRVLLIETSAATTSADQLADFQSAAKQLVNSLSTDTSVAVIRFDGGTTMVQAPIQLADQATKDTVNSAIDGITLGNDEIALGTALQAAHTLITGMGDTIGAGTAVYLFSSGESTTGAAPLDFIGNYSALSLPLYAFDYGNSPESASTLHLLAGQSGGTARDVQEGLGSLLRGLEDVERIVGLRQVFTLQRATVELDADSTQQPAVVVDAGLSEISFNVVVLGDLGATTLMITMPDSSTQALDSCETLTRASGTISYCSTTMASPQSGTWQLQLTSSQPLFVDYWVQGVLGGKTTYLADVQSQNGYLVTYPQPLQLSAHVAQDALLVAGLAVEGTLVDPYGNSFTLTFADDGEGPDATAADGLYTALYIPQINGDYQIDVQFKAATETTLTDLAFIREPTIIQNEQGEEEPFLPDPTNTPNSEQFERHVSLITTVTGAPIIGPNGERATDSGPEELPPNNATTNGRISSTERSLRYKVTVPADATGAYVIRINSLALGMDPVVNLVNADESWARTATLANGATELVIGLGVAAGDTVFIEVSHADANATDGLFAISAGPRLAGDTSDLPPAQGLTPLLPEGSSATAIFLPLVQR